MSKILITLFLVLGITHSAISDTKSKNDITLNNAQLSAVPISTKSFKSSRAACPDLIVSDFHLQGPLVTFSGESLQNRLKATWMNIGDMGSGQFEVGFYIADDTLPGATEQLLDFGTVTIGSAAPLQTDSIIISETANIPFDWPNGESFLICKIDHLDQQQECNESNNFFTLPMPITNYSDSLERKLPYTLGIPISSSYDVVPLDNGIYNSLGVSLFNPSIIDTISIKTINIPLAKEPGVPFDTSFSMEIRINRLINDSLTEMQIFIDTITGFEIASQFPVVDSVINFHFEIRENNSNNPLPQSPGDKWIFILHQLTGNPSHGVLLVTTEEDPVNEDIGPCDNTAYQSFELNGFFSSLNEFKQTSSVPVINYSNRQIPITFRTVTTSYTTIPIVDTVTIEYMAHFSNNWPNSLNNQMDIYINPLWLQRDLPNIPGTKVMDEIKVYIAGVETIYPRSSYESTGILSIPDAGMDFQETGRHLVNVKASDNEAYRACFYNEPKPLLEAPWADVTTTFNPGSGDGEYVMEAIVPPINLGFDKPLKLFKKTYDNILDMNMGFEQTFYTADGSNSSTITDNHLELTILNKELLSTNISGLYAGEYLSGDEPVYRFGMATDTIQIVDIVLYNGRVIEVHVWLGAVSFTVDAELGVEGFIILEAALSTPPEPYGQLVLTPVVAPYGILDAELSLLWGAGKVHGSVKPKLQLQFPITMEIDSNAEVQVSSDFCMVFDTDYSWYVKVLGAKIAQGSGTWEVYDGCSKASAVPQTANSSTDYMFDEYYYGAAALTSLHGTVSKNLVAFVHVDDPSGDQIWYSIKNGNTWDTPIPATNTNFPKSDVQVCSYKKKSVAAIWVENTSTMDTVGFTEDSLLTALTHQEITVALYDDSSKNWSTPVRLTNNSVTDGLPNIAGSHNRLFAVWVQNTNLTALDQSSMRIFYSMYNDTVWTPATEIPNQNGYNLQPDVVVDSTGSALVVWIHDNDADPLTHSDRELMSCKVGSDGIALIPSISPIPSTLGPAAPSVYSKDSSIYIAYESYGYRDDSLGNPTIPVGVGDQVKIATSIFDGTSWTSSFLATPDSVATGMTPKLNKSDNGNLYLIYRNYEHNESSVQDGEIAFATRSLLPGSQWSYPTRLTNDTLRTYPDAVDIDPFGRPMVVYRKDSLTTNFMAGFDKIYELTVSEYNTPTGSNIEMDLGYGAVVTFDQVSASGFTSVALTDEFAPDPGHTTITAFAWDIIKYCRVFR